MAGTETRLGYRPALDGLRAIAVVLVMAYHLWIDRVPGGWLGVDLFFVLSGFLITTLLLEEQEQYGDVWLGGFYQRRTLRLMPALFAFLAVLALYRALINTSFMPRFMDWVPGVYITNAIAAFGLGNAGYAHIWSLAAEEQFYLLWPPLLVVLLRRRVARSTILVVTTAAVAASAVLALALWARGAGWMRLYFGPDTHAVPILVGCLVGEAWSWGVLPRIERLLVPSIFVLAVAAITLRPQDDLVYTGGLGLIAAAGAVLIAAIIRLPRVAAPLSARPLVKLGRYSYAMYLWHPFLIYLAGSSDFERLGAVLLSYPVAALSMRVVEGPCLALKQRLTRPAV